MELDESIFPDGCLEFRRDGNLNEMGKLGLQLSIAYESRGKGVERPCYECRLPHCKARVVGHHDEVNRFIIKPTEGEK